MIKFRLYFDKDEETEWLNKMSDRGLDLVRFFAGVYVFKKSGCKYIYHVDYVDEFGRVSEEYRELMEDTGIEIVQNWGCWVILRKPAADGEFKLYTDIESEIAHYTKIKKMFVAAAILEFICLCVEAAVAAIAFSPYNHIMLTFLEVFFIEMINIINKTTNKINKLKEMQTGIVYEEKNVTSALIIGLILNALPPMLNSEYDFLSNIIQIIAVILILTGIRDMCDNLRKDKY